MLTPLKQRSLILGLPLAALAVLAAAFLGKPALADDMELNVQNNSGIVMDEIYISPSGSSARGSNVLHESLDPEESTGIVFEESSASCQYDVHVVFSTGEYADFPNEDLCSLETLEVAESDIMSQ